MHRDTSSQDKAPKPIEVDAAREDIKLAEANPLVQDDADESNDGTSQDAVADLMLGDYVQRFNIIPRCVLNCAHWRVLEHGCAYLDHTCFCQQIGPVLYELGVQSCIEDCQFLGEQAYAKGSIIEYCRHDEHHIKFPPYMLHYKDLFRRQTSSDGQGSVAPQTTQTTTISSTLSPSIAPFTSTFTGPKSAAITAVQSVTSLSITHPISSSSSYSSSSYSSFSSYSSSSSSSSSSLLAPNPKPTAASSSSGLSTGAKVGIGVSVPIICILLALGILWFLRRRKNQKKNSVSTIEPEKNDGGLPELTSTLHNSNAQEAGGVPVHEMHADPEHAGLHGNYTNPPSELHDNQMNPSHQPHGNQTAPSHVLAAGLKHQDRFPPPDSVSQEPIATTIPGSSSFPPPWENSSNNEFTPQQTVGDPIDEEREAAELARLQEEVARMKQRRERLQQLQDLEAREEELERSIRQRTKGGSSRA